MEKTCSANQCLNPGMAKVGEFWYCSDHYRSHKVSEAIAAGGVILCATKCLDHLSLEEIGKLQDAGKGECPCCHHTGWLKVTPRSNLYTANRSYSSRYPSKPL